MNFVYKSFALLPLWVMLVLYLDLVHAKNEESRYRQVPVCAPFSPTATQGKLTGCGKRIFETSCAA